MTDRSLATRLIALRVLKDLLAETDAETRAEIQAGMMVGDRATAVVYDTEPTVVGHVQLAKGTSSTTAAVTDAAALLEWVKTYVPGEVQTVELVRPAFQKRLLDQVKADGGWLDQESGEIFEVPGVTVSQPDPKPSLRVVPADGAADVIRKAWVDGRLSINDLTALPSGDAA